MKRYSTNANEGQLGLSDVWRFLDVYRGREGFTRSDASEIQEAFKRYEREPIGEISPTEVGKVLRWLGYPTPWDLQQHLVAEIDVNKDCKLNLQELRKLVRKYQEREVMEMTKAFKQQDAASNGYISERQAESALRVLGCDVRWL